ncbi:MAG: CinA family nicotinamide mononucleotide deamidase-related protein [Anaerolineae bacterium]
MSLPIPPVLNAEIVAIGTEILLGEITDTNSVYLARHLRDLGVNLYFMTTVGDNEGRITDAIRLALGRAQVVITCGGLGPTVDDMTRQGVAAATNRELEFHPHLLDAIAARFSSFRASMTANNTRQAYVPSGALIIDNPVGTAPSFIVEVGESCVISLPGVPREMKFLFEERVIPYLRERYQLGGSIIKARVLRTAGIGESMLDERIGDDLLTASNPTVGLAAHSGQVDVRITAKAATAVEADAMISQFEAVLRERIGAHIFGVDGDTLDGALLSALREAGAQLSVLEAGVAPIISERAKQFGPLGIDVEVIHLEDEAAARERLGGAETVSLRDLAETTVRDICAQSGQGIAVAAISRADDTEDQADSAERTALAVCYRGEVRSRTYGFGGQSDEVRQFLVTWAWAMAWRMLRDAQ